jgi:hypothetical protein
MGGAVIGAVVGRRAALPADIGARFPDLSSVHWRRGGVPVWVAGMFLGRRGVSAITLWNVVFLAHDAPWDPELLLHELRHVHQFGERLAFPVLYLLESIRRGYFHNRYEVDARSYAASRLRRGG